MTSRPRDRHTDMIATAMPLPDLTDDPAFADLAERHRHELQVHCYRMLGSFDEAEDLVQETLLRAWRRRGSYAGRAPARAWLYGIATNACLDAIAARARTVPAGTAAVRASEVPWLQPFPDELLDRAAPSEEQPHAAVVAKETIELAFLVALQHLPARQRAALILRDVLGWSARETAGMLATSVPAANSALQRARATLRAHLPGDRTEWSASTELSPSDRALLERYIETTERSDVDGLAATLRDDVRFSMPPHPFASVGREETVGAWVQGGFGTETWGAMRCLATAANRQPAIACYVRRPGRETFVLFAVDVLRIEAGLVAEIVTFTPKGAAGLGLPAAL